MLPEILRGRGSSTNTSPNASVAGSLVDGSCAAAVALAAGATVGGAARVCTEEEAAQVAESAREQDALSMTSPAVDQIQRPESSNADPTVATKSNSGGAATPFSTLGAEAHCRKTDSSFGESFATARGTIND